LCLLPRRISKGKDNTKWKALLSQLPSQRPETHAFVNQCSMDDVELNPAMLDEIIEPPDQTRRSSMFQRVATVKRRKSTRHTTIFAAADTREVSDALQDLGDGMHASKLLRTKATNMTMKKIERKLVFCKPAILA
jgi:hypothetical protein